MKKIIRSPGSGTIVNAIATGYGAAFGIGLDIICKANTIDKNIKCRNDVNTNNSLMEICAKNVYSYFGIDEDDFGIELSTTSSLPMASGLSSSSALSNGIVSIVSNIICEEFDFKKLNDMDIINLAIDSSLEARVSVTGSFDDATASYFGGLTVTNNLNREFIIKENFNELPVIIFMPNYYSKSIDVDVKKIKLISPYVELAFGMAKRKEYFKALNLNGLLYSGVLGFDCSIAFDALNNGALASGLSGTGSAFLAICNEESIDDIKESWSHYEGNIFETYIDNEGCKFLK